MPTQQKKSALNIEELENVLDVLKERGAFKARFKCNGFEFEVEFDQGSGVDRSVSTTDRAKPSEPEHVSKQVEQKKKQAAVFPSFLDEEFDEIDPRFALERLNFTPGYEVPRIEVRKDEAPTEQSETEDSE